MSFAANLPRSKRETRLLSRSKKFVDQLRDHSLCQFRVLGLTSSRSAHQMRQKAVDPICEDWGGKDKTAKSNVRALQG